MLRIKRDELKLRVEAIKDTLPGDQFVYLMRVAKNKPDGELTAMELSEVCRWLRCLPNDIVEWT